MIVVGAASHTAEHVEVRPAVAARKVEQVMVDAVQQVEAVQALLLIEAAVPGTAVPVGDDMQADGDFGTLDATAQSGPRHGAELYKNGRCVEHFFLLDVLYLFVPEVEGPDNGVSVRVCQLFQLFDDAEVEEFSHNSLLLVSIISRMMRSTSGCMPMN